MASTAVQNPQEFAWFTELLKREGVKSYLEIGSKLGGSLWLAGMALPAGSRIVSVDLPWGNGATRPFLETTVVNLRSWGYDVHLFLGDSTDPAIISQVRALGPFDAIFIDANHTMKYVTADWENYGAMGRIIAFHDISFYRPVQNPGKLPIDVPRLWEQLKQNYRYDEIKLDPHDNGIGVLWK